MSTDQPTGPIRRLLSIHAPPWMRRDNGVRLVEGLLGLTGDSMLQAALCAMKSNLLAEPESPYDAVLLVGNDRVMEAYPTDTTATHRARLLGAWEAWGRSGEETSLLDQVSRFGFPNSLLITAVEWSGEVEGSGNRRIWVVLPQISSGSKGEEEVRGVYRLVNKFRAGEERLEDVIGVRSGRLWDFHPTTGEAGTWNSPGVATWGESQAVSYRGLIDG